ncbi:hypothetical protein, partial [Paenibacillus sp. CCS19]|uniref:hypothetical protein n=1 Tax=Paenibacillus sp. CCS19 TaxID=3158387 RepID=UPI00295F008F
VGFAYTPLLVLQSESTFSVLTDLHLNLFSFRKQQKAYHKDIAGSRPMYLTSSYSSKTLRASTIDAEGLKGLCVDDQEE